jgi:cytochrome c peroxidase
MTRPHARVLIAIAASTALSACVAGIFAGAAGPAGAEEEEPEPAEIVAGERLFLETRFAQHFFAGCGGDVNARGVARDPVMDRTLTTGDALRGPFRGDSMNCRACHLVDEHRDSRGGGVRTYADFARRSPIPDRGDGATTTLRNSPSLVGASRRRAGELLLHFDGEFATPEDLAVGTFTGRNFGWLPAERDQAVRHIAHVLRRDDGAGGLAQEFGGVHYARLLTGESSSIPAELRLPRGFRIDVEHASDEALVRAAARLVAAYMRSLDFARDRIGLNSGSAYDAFLRKNDLPRSPRGRETPERYGARLRKAVERLDAPKFVDQRDGDLTLHGGESFLFRPAQLRGLRVFLTRPADEPGATSGVGNCVACHAPPSFTDNRFHSTGVSQLEYDRAHGDGAFVALEIPALAARDADRDAWLPATVAHPAARGPFATVPSADSPGRADLGLWNVFGDPDRPRPQTKLRRLLGLEFGAALSDADLLDRSVAAFKTPSLRDLGQSSPYLHDGSADGLEDVVRFYVTVSDLARAGRLRNADPTLADVRIDESDVRDLAAFLASLDEDYE